MRSHAESHDDDGGGAAPPLARCDGDDDDEEEEEPAGGCDASAPTLLRLRLLTARARRCAAQLLGTRPRRMASASTSGASIVKASCCSYLPSSWEEEARYQHVAREES